MCSELHLNTSRRVVSVVYRYLKAIFFIMRAFVDTVVCCSVNVCHGIHYDAT